MHDPTTCLDSGGGKHCWRASGLIVHHGRLHRLRVCVWCHTQRLRAYRGPRARTGRTI